MILKEFLDFPFTDKTTVITDERTDRVNCRGDWLVSRDRLAEQRPQADRLAEQRRTNNPDISQVAAARKLFSLRLLEG